MWKRVKGSFIADAGAGAADAASAASAASVADGKRSSVRRHSIWQPLDTPISIHLSALKFFTGTRSCVHAFMRICVYAYMHRLDCNLGIC
jgi:hypothetical protein